MPVLKTFKGKLKMNFSYPWMYGPRPPPNNMTINTSNIITNDNFKYSNWEQNLAFIQSFNKIDFNYGSEPKSTNKYLESVNLLDIKEDDTSKSWDLNLEKPFNSIIFKFTSIGSQARVWITGISFEKSR